MVLSHHKLTTRKPHKCWGCTKEFPKGTSMWRCVNKDGTLLTTYWCESCQAFVDWLEKEDHSIVEEGFSCGEVRDLIAEHVREREWPQP